MKIITVEALPEEIYEKYGLVRDRSVNTYNVPSRAEHMANSKDTWGSQYDPVERRVIEGGLPLFWEQVE